MMKRISLLLLITIIDVRIISCQITGAEGDLLFEDTLTLRPLYPWITIPSSEENIWQVGKLYKDFLDSTLSGKHGIVTDTLNSYPVNIDDYFDIVLPVMDSAWGEGILSFYHRYQTDSLYDGGFIEVSYDYGISWNNIIFDASHINENFIGLYNQSDTISGGIPAFTGTNYEWSYVELYWWWIALLKKNSTGKLEFEKKIYSSGSIDLSFLNSGIYVFNIYVENNRINSGTIIKL